MSPELLATSITVILLAGLVHGTFGIGFPMIATPLLALVTDVRTAVFVTLLPTVAVNVSVLLSGESMRSAIGPHWRIVPYVLVGTVLGSLLLVSVDPRPFLLVLAGAILLYLNQHSIKRLSFAWVHRHTRLSYALFGLASGLMAGTVNVMVPILIILTMELQMAMQAMIKLFNLNFLAGKLTQTGVFLGSGQLEQGFLLQMLWLVPVALVGLLAGSRIRRHISETRYQRILRGLLWLMSGVLVVRYFAG